MRRPTDPPTVDLRLRGEEPTPEQDARDMLERMGVEDAQSWSGGELAELANLIAEVRRLRSLSAEDADLLERAAGACRFRSVELREAGNPTHQRYREDAAALDALAARLRSVRGEP